jgi:hypothetical protein
MPDEPQVHGRSADVDIQQVGPGNGPDPTTLDEVVEPGQKRNAADVEWLSMATADPAHFLKDLRPE